MTKIGKKYLAVKHKQKYKHIIVYFTRKLTNLLDGGKKGKNLDKNNRKLC